MAERRAEREAEVTAVMLRVFDKVQRNRRLARDYGTGDHLSMVEAEACQLIASTDGISPSDLADLIGVSRSAVSQALGRMRARGLVTIEHPPRNAKVRVVRVTAAGSRVAAGVNDLYKQMSKAVYDGLEENLDAFLILFNRLDSFFAEVIAESRERAD